MGSIPLSRSEKALLAAQIIERMAREQRDQAGDVLNALERLASARSQKAWLLLDPSDPDALAMVIAGVRAKLMRQIVMVTDDPPDTARGYIGDALENFILSNRSVVLVRPPGLATVFRVPEGEEYIPPALSGAIKMMAGDREPISVLKANPTPFPPGQSPGKNKGRRLVPHLTEEGKLTKVPVEVATKEAADAVVSANGDDPARWIRLLQREGRFNSESVIVSPSVWSGEIPASETLSLAREVLLKRARNLASAGGFQHVIIEQPTPLGVLAPLPGGLLAMMGSALLISPRVLMSPVKIGAIGLLTAVNPSFSDPRIERLGPSGFRISLDGGEPGILRLLRHKMSVLGIRHDIPEAPQALDQKTSAAIGKMVFGSEVEDLRNGPGKERLAIAYHLFLLSQLEEGASADSSPPGIPEVGRDDLLIPANDGEKQGEVVSLSEWTTYRQFLQQLGVVTTIAGRRSPQPFQFLISLLETNGTHDSFLKELRLLERVMEEDPTLISDPARFLRFVVARYQSSLASERETFSSGTALDFLEAYIQRESMAAGKGGVTQTFAEGLREKMEEVTRVAREEAEKKRGK